MAAVRAPDDRPLVPGPLLLPGAPGQLAVGDPPGPRRAAPRLGEGFAHI
jgi:hypothetical protein